MLLESFLTNEIPPLVKREVEDFLDSQNTSHPFQFPEWSDPGAKILLLRENRKIGWSGVFTVYRPLGRKLPFFRVAASNRGPVCDDRALWAAILEHLPEYFRNDRATYIEVSPDWSEEDSSRPVSSGWASVSSNRVSLRLDLHESDDAIFSHFRKVSRYEIRRAERAGATVVEASTEEEIDQFLAIYREMSARKGFPSDELDRMRRQIRWLMHSAERGALLLARHEDAVRGGVVIARAARRCWYVWGATQIRPQLNVGHILQWNALRWAKQHGCTEYDFGGYTPGATSGPAWFKAGFGGEEVRFVRPFRRIVRPTLYRVFSLLSGSNRS